MLQLRIASIANCFNCELLQLRIADCGLRIADLWNAADEGLDLWCKMVCGCNSWIAHGLATPSFVATRF